MAVTLDPVNLGSTITLSPDKLTATTATAGAWSVARTTTTHASPDLVYCEFKVISGSGGAEALGAGFINSTGSVNNYLGNDLNSIGWYNPGDIFSNGGVLATIASFNTANTFLGIAYNFNTGKFWLTADGTTWNAGGSASPVTGVGGYNLASGALFAALALNANNGGTCQMIANFAGPFNYSSTFTTLQGAGYSAWDSGAATAITFVASGDAPVALRRFRALPDNLAWAIGPPKGEFLPNFMSQWFRDRDIIRLPPIRPLPDEARWRFNPPASVTLSQVATRCIVPNFSNIAYTQAMTRRGYIARIALSSFQIIVPNWYVVGNNPEAGPGASTTVTASIEYPLGTFTQVKFGGSVSGTIASNSSITSDAISLSIPNGATFYARLYCTNPNGVVLYSNGSVNFANSSFGDLANIGTSGITDQTMGGTITQTSPTAVFGLTAIIAQSTIPAIALIGDSRTAGYLDTPDASGDVGILARSIGPTHPYINLGVNGDTAVEWVLSNTNRMALINFCRYAICALGINDINLGSSVAAILAAYQTLYGIVNKPIWQTTIDVISSSTDGWITTGNQSPWGLNTSRISLNTSIRTGLAQVRGYLEIADVVETSRNSGLWNVPGWTTDGTHESQIACLAIAASGAINPYNFEGIFAQWQPQSDAGKVAQLRPLPDEVHKQVGLPPAAPIPSFVSQWFRDKDITQLRLPRSLDKDNQVEAVGAPRGEFLLNFLSQWHGQSDTGKVPPPPKPLPDEIRWAVGAPRGEFLANIPGWMSHGEVFKLPPVRPPDSQIFLPGVPAGEFLASFVSEWIGQSDIRPLPGERPPDPEVRWSIGPAAGEFLTVYMPEWYRDRDIARLPPFLRLDNKTEPVSPGQAQFLVNFSAWISASEIAKLPPARPLDNLAMPWNYIGMFLPNFLGAWDGRNDIFPVAPRLRQRDDVSAPYGMGPPFKSVAQWLGQSDVIRLPPLRPLDNPAAPLGITPGQFAPTLLSEWFWQSAISRLAPPRPLDDPRSSIGPIGSLPIPSFVGQWHGQTDIGRLAPPHPLDNPGAPWGVAQGQFLPSFVTDWFVQSDIGRILGKGALDNLTIALGTQVVRDLVSQWMSQTDPSKVRLGVLPENDPFVAAPTLPPVFFPHLTFSEISRLRPPRPPDADETAIWKGAAEFLVQHVSNWIGQTDIAKLPPLRPSIETGAPVRTTPGQFLPNFVSEWIGQSDMPRLTIGRLPFELELPAHYFTQVLPPASPAEKTAFYRALHRRVYSNNAAGQCQL